MQKRTTLKETWALDESGDLDNVLAGVDFWEEFRALPWKVQQECERLLPDRVRQLELGFVKELRFPMDD
jgi:hypothetical protein